MILENWFPTPIWHDQVDFDFRSVAIKCFDLQKSYPNRVLSNNGGWQSEDINLNDYEELRVVRSIIDQKIAELNQDVGSMRLALDNAWININFPGSSNVIHNHPIVAFAGTIYINVDENSGDIVFHDDFSPIKHYPIDRDKSKIFFRTVTYKPRNGMIIFFPAWLSHTVNVNQSHIKRVSISFNVRQLREPGTTQG